MRSDKWILLILLLFVSLTTAADDAVSPRGCRRGVLPQPTRAARRAEGAPKQVGGDYYVGDRHQLTVLVSFSDQQFMQEDPLPVWDRILNEPNYTEGSFYGSVHDYFYAQSKGDFRLTFDLQRVELDQSRVKYRSTASDDENSQYLVNDIVDVLLTRDIDWSLYDWNGNGYINQLLIIYAGKAMNADGDYNTIWPHQWWLSEHQKDRQKGVYCEPRTVTAGGRQYLVDSYCATMEEVYGDYRSFATLCHEYSHCFGLPDFYGAKGSPHNWDLMDNSYNKDGFCPGNYSGHERMMMGWFTPKSLTTTHTVSNMPANEAYIIYNDAHPDEYYMVENRQQTGWDSALPGSGLVVFHVDYNEYTWLYDWVNTDDDKASGKKGKLRYHLFRANNKTSYSYESGWAYPFLANDSLTNNSLPAATLNNENTDGTKLMNKSLRDISIADGLASFRFTIDPSTGIDELEAEGQPRELYRIGPVTILRYPNGVVRKVVRKD